MDREVNGDRPPDYPTELEECVELRDGSRIWIRPIHPADAPDLAAAIEQADRETLTHRFFTAAPHLSDKQIHYLAEVDYKRRLALVAVDEDGNGAAIARYESHPDSDVAEVAIVVAPEWRRRGLATELVRRLEDPARERGVVAFDAIYLPENRAVAAVFQRLDYTEQRVEGGLAHVSKPLI
ncbi:MAG: GNAT family N-acetyltransferase [Actinomycetota bacterium]